MKVTFCGKGVYVARHRGDNLVIADPHEGKVTIERADIPALLHAIGLCCSDVELNHFEGMPPPRVKVEND